MALYMGHAEGVPDAPVTDKPMLSIIIDDIGYNAITARALIRLTGPISFSVLPQAPHSQELAQLAWMRGRDVMLHVPMATHTGARLDPGGISLAMTPSEITHLLQQHLQHFPQALGVNNHMGSRLTEMSSAMLPVMRALKPHNYYFVDSRTSAESVAYRVARQQGLSAAKRDVFLDNDQNPMAIAQQLEKAVKLAEKNGAALAIGHPYTNTLAVLAAQLPSLAGRVQLVPSSHYVRLASHNPRDEHHIFNPNWQVKTPWLQGSLK